MTISGAYKAEMLWDMRVGVKVGICGLHYHLSNPFLFHGFFPIFLFWNFQIFITLVMYGS